MNIVVIGGGASGIACAIKTKLNNPDCSVTVLEHLDEPCKKIFATGNGRCNITNKYAPGFETTKNFFESIGLVLRESEDGRMYPYSNQASSVVETLVSNCRKLNINIVTSCTVKSAEKTAETFSVFTDKGVFSGDVLVLATGGKAQSALGSDGSGYSLAQTFGHKISALSPALVQLKSPNKNCRALKGIRAKCLVKLVIGDEIAKEEFGEVLFTDYGLSGIVVMNLSHLVCDEKIKNDNQRYSAVIDFVPEMTEEELLSHYKKFGNFEGILPLKLCTVLSRQAEGNEEKMAKYIKNWRLIISGTKGYEYAQITKGGIEKDELDESFQSKLCDNLYIIGELTDNQFPCGGFNLDFAWSSGVKAANKIAEQRE
ncbi:MAG: aminoacetone oxidase family FAD-binding enzyme [Eubacterium sp.]|nr:aminoacetone oxidase family FAD-binding enzyme [Eubacterium sp.]MBR7060980.1 aminoacetone oxidase family FAD-binding enzyme [Eubacterium sp.]